MADIDSIAITFFMLNQFEENNQNPIFSATLNEREVGVVNA